MRVLRCNDDALARSIASITKRVELQLVWVPSVSMNASLQNAARAATAAHAVAERSVRRQDITQ